MRPVYLFEDADFTLMKSGQMIEVTLADGRVQSFGYAGRARRLAAVQRNGHETHRKFSEDFKSAAVAKLNANGGRAAARELGVTTALLYKWRQRAGAGGARNQSAFPRPGGVGTRRTFTDQDKAAHLAAMRKAGETAWAYGKRVGIQPSVIKAWVKRAAKRRKK